MASPQEMHQKLEILIETDPTNSRAYKTYPESELDALKLAVVVLASSNEHYMEITLQAFKRFGTDWWGSHQDQDKE